MNGGIFTNIKLVPQKGYQMDTIIIVFSLMDKICFDLFPTSAIITIIQVLSCNAKTNMALALTWPSLEVIHTYGCSSWPPRILSKTKTTFRHKGYIVIIIIIIPPKVHIVALL